MANNFELGFIQKLGTPAHIRLESDALTEKERSAAARTLYNDWIASGRGYIDNFILTAVKSRREEKSHVFTSLNEFNTTFFFGSMPIVYSFSGVVYDMENQEWYNDFNFYYEKYLKGTSSVRNKTRVFVVFADQIIEGFLLSMTMGKDSQMNDAVSISFDFLMTQEIVIGATSPLKGRGKNSTKRVDSKSTNSRPPVAPEGTTKEQYKNLVKKEQLSGLPFSNLNLPGMAAQMLGSGSPSSMLNTLLSEVGNIVGASNPLAGFANQPDPRLTDSAAKDPLSFVADVQKFAANPALQVAGQFFPKIQPFTQALADPLGALDKQGVPASELAKFYRAIATKKAADKGRA